MELHLLPAALRPSPWVAKVPGCQHDGGQTLILTLIGANQTGKRAGQMEGARRSDRWADKSDSSLIFRFHFNVDSLGSDIN